MTAECPICLESKLNLAEEPLFQCDHTICDECSVNLLKHHCMNSCPMCRADPKPSNQFNVQVVTGERQIFFTDSGHYRLLFEDRIEVGRVEQITDLEEFLVSPIVVGVRYVDSTVAYLVHGPPSKSLLDMLSVVPEASKSGRTGRHARIELSRETDLFAELINGYALPAVEFVRNISFPVRLVEIELNEEEADNEDTSDTEQNDPSSPTEMDHDAVLSQEDHMQIEQELERNSALFNLFI